MAIYKNALAPVAFICEVYRSVRRAKCRASACLLWVARLVFSQPCHSEVPVAMRECHRLTCGCMRGLVNGEQAGVGKVPGQSGAG